MSKKKTNKRSAYQVFCYRADKKMIKFLSKKMDLSLTIRGLLTNIANTEGYNADQ